MSIDIETMKLKRMIDRSILEPDGLLMPDLAPQQAPLPECPYTIFYGGTINATGVDLRAACAYFRRQ